MNRNTKLLGIFILQVVVIAVIAAMGNRSASLDYDPKAFTIADTASITKILLKRGEEEIVLTKENGPWRVNNEFNADASLVRTIKSVLNRVEVKRPVSLQSNSVIISELEANGTQVEITQNGKVSSFYAGGNDTRTVSYFGEEGKAYIMGVPGYQDYVSAIFSLTKIQWKDRLIFSSSWRSVNTIQVDHQTKQDFTIQYKDSDLSVLGIDPLDSAQMMNYVYQFESYFVNEHIAPGQFERYDSLSTTEPLASLTITDIDESKNLTVKIFPSLPNEGYHLLIDDKDRWMMLDRKRAAGLLPEKKDFIKVDQ